MPQKVVHDQKSFALGEVSKSVLVNTDSKFNHSCEKLDNFEVQRDGAIQPRKGFEKVLDVQSEFENLVLYEGLAFFIKDGRVFYEKDGNKREILFNASQIQTFNLISGDSFQITSIRFKESVRYYSNFSFPNPLKAINLKVSNKTLFVFFEDGVPFVLWRVQDKLFVFPYFADVQKNADFFRVRKTLDGFETDLTEAARSSLFVIEHIFEKLPFYLDKNSDLVFEFQQSSLDSSIYELKAKNKNPANSNDEYEDLSSFLNVPLIMNADFPEVDVEKAHVETEGVDTSFYNLSSTNPSRSASYTSPIINVADSVQDYWADADRVNNLVVLPQYISSNPRVRTIFRWRGISSQELRDFYRRHITDESLTDEEIVYTRNLPGVEIYKDKASGWQRGYKFVDGVATGSFLVPKEFSYSRFKEGTGLEQEFVFSYFQTLSDRFFFLYPFEVSADGRTLQCRLMSFGAREVDLTQKFENMTNVFVCSFKDGNYFKDVISLRDRNIWFSKNGGVSISAEGEFNKMSDPIKLMYSNRFLNLKYRGSAYLGGTAQLYKYKARSFEEDYYYKFLKRVKKREQSFSLGVGDPTTFRLRDAQGQDLEIYEVVVSDILDALKLYIFTSSGVYLLDLYSYFLRGGGLVKLTDLKTSREVRPFIAQNNLFFTDEKAESLFVALLDNSNNVRFIFTETGKEYFGLWSKIKAMFKISETEMFVQTDEDVLYRFNIFPKAIAGCSEYRTKYAFKGISNETFIFEDENRFILAQMRGYKDFGEVFNAKVLLFYMARSSKEATLDFYTTKTIQEIYIVKKDNLSLSLGNSELGYRLVSSWAGAEFTEEDVCKVPFNTGNFRVMQSGVELVQPSDGEGRVFGLSIVMQVSGERV